MTNPEFNVKFPNFIKLLRRVELSVDSKCYYEIIYKLNHVIMHYTMNSNIYPELWTSSFLFATIDNNSISLYFTDVIDVIESDELDCAEGYQIILQDGAIIEFLFYNVEE